MKKFAVLALVLLGGFVLADDKKPGISVILSDFKLKGATGTESLLGHNSDEGKLFFYVNGTATATVKIPDDGEYDIVVKASGDSALNEKAKFKLAVDGDPVGKETTLTTDDAKEYTLTAKLKKGDRNVSIEYTNDVYKEGSYDRNFYVHGVSVKRKP